MVDSFPDETTPVPNKGAVPEVSEGTPSPSLDASCSGKIKRFFLYEFSRRDVQAFYFNQFGRSVLFISVMFLSLGILELANEQAGCPKNPETGAFESCDNKVYGLAPSSMLSLMATIGGIATSIFMPYAGAVVDYSENRLRFGRTTTLIFVLITMVQVFIFPSTWFVLTLLEGIVASASYYGNSMFMWSYVSAENDEDLYGITGCGGVWESGGMLIFFIIVGGVQFATSWDAVETARFSQALAAVVGGISLFLAFRRYEPVRALKSLGENENLYTAGVRSLWFTLRGLRTTLPSVHRYLLGYIFIAAAVESFSTLAITYLSDQVQMSDLEIVIFILLNVAINPIGVLLHLKIANYTGHKKNYLLVNAFLLIVACVFTGVVAGPDQKNIAFIFAILFGIALGWYYPSSNGFYISIVPSEMKMELWGWNMFGARILSWGPPLLFTVLNEVTGNLRLGMIGLILFELLGLLIAYTIPNNTATASANVSDEASSGLDV